MPEEVSVGPCAVALRLDAVGGAAPFSAGMPEAAVLVVGVLFVAASLPSLAVVAVFPLATRFKMPRGFVEADREARALAACVFADAGMTAAAVDDFSAGPRRLLTSFVPT